MGTIRGSAGGTPLIGTGSRPGGRLGGGAKGLLRTFLILLALFAAALVLAGCGGARSGGDPPQASGEDERASQPDESKPEKAAGDGRASKAKLGHPSLGSAEAPVVLTEYSDYQ